MEPVVALLGTLDTKGREIEYVRECITMGGCKPLVVDCGIKGEPPFSPEVPATEVASAAGTSVVFLREAGDRGAAVGAMARGAEAVVARLHSQGAFQAIMGLGGSAGTTIAAQAMRVLPVGVPKLLVSTVASGDVRPYVGIKDLCMMYSVVDIAGLNRLSRRILGNAAAAIAGMALAAANRREDEKAVDRPLIGATMFGVTTPCVNRLRECLEAGGCEVLVFHATGTGGQAMESLIEDGYIVGVADITTTELADELVGGVFSAGPDRLAAAGRKGIPQVVSVGALDMVNFGPLDSVPTEFKRRVLYEHNPTVTLMRTNLEECRRLGEMIAEKLNAASGPVAVCLPLRGISAYDSDSHPFGDPVADEALFEAIRRNLHAHVKCVPLDMHINDPAFAEAVADTLLSML